MHSSIATPELVANHCPENALDHLCFMEHPDVYIIFPSSCSSQYSPQRIIWHIWTTFKYSIQQNFDMALRIWYDLAGWESTFIEAGISATSAKIYVQTFSSEEIPRDCLHMLDCTMVMELGIKTMGNVLTMLKLTKEPLVSPASLMKPPTAKLPQLSSEMTAQQFQKFRIDWGIFIRRTNLPTAQTNVQLYNSADETVQNSIINTYPEFFNTSSNKLLDMLEVLVMQKSNPIVYRISFSSIT